MRPVMTRSLASFVTILSMACGGTATPAEAPPGSDSAAATSPAEPEPAGPDASAPSSDESWEGEAEATGVAPAGDPGAAGETRTTDVIAKIIKDNRKSFRDCYEKGTKELPDLQGTLTLHFVLDPEGKIKKAELNQERSTLKAPPVVDCAIGVLKQLRFPPSSKGMESTINYPFDFKR